jgi:hypothetical protein
VPHFPRLPSTTTPTRSSLTLVLSRRLLSLARHDSSCLGDGVRNPLYDYLMGFSDATSFLDNRLAQGHSDDYAAGGHRRYWYDFGGSTTL